jgi:hypothetical protein
MTDLVDPTKVIYQPAGYFMAPEGEERVGVFQTFYLVMDGLQMMTELFSFIMLLQILGCM